VSKHYLTAKGGAEGGLWVGGKAGRVDCVAAGQRYGVVCPGVVPPGVSAQFCWRKDRNTGTTHELYGVHGGRNSSLWRNRTEGFKQ
jgi:hypothetical protein